MYIQMGWTYLSRGAGHEQNALKVFRIVLSEAHSSALLDSAFRGMGIAYYDLRKWNRAIEAFNKSLHELLNLYMARKHKRKHMFTLGTHILKSIALYP